MKKVINTEKLREMVKDRLLGDGGLVPEHRINRIIKEYLSERNEFLDDETPIEDVYEFKPRTQKALEDMSEGLEEMIGDLELIKEKENNVLVDTDVYADGFINDMVSSLEGVKEDLLYLKSLSSGDDEITDEEPMY